MFWNGFSDFCDVPYFICFFSVGDNRNSGVGGDASVPVDVYEMELWDTVANTITAVPHPPGFESKKFFRPMISTFGDNSILFTGGSINNEEDHDGEIFQYTCDGTPSGTWESRGYLNPALVSRQMYGTYTINEEKQNQRKILSTCSEEP